MQSVTDFQQRAFAGAWVWLFPLTYLVHIVEEYWGGPGFYRWIARIVGTEMSAQTFLNLNLVFWMAMTGMVVVAFMSQAFAWLTVALGAIALVNGLAHTIGSLITQSYSPGVISGLCLWIPLGSWTLRHAWQNLPRRSVYAGVLLGLTLHGLVTLLALTSINP